MNEQSTDNDEYLIEGNSHRDRVWGMVHSNGEWEGQNLLGRLLMARRYELELGLT